MPSPDLYSPLSARIADAEPREVLRILRSEPAAGAGVLGVLARHRLGVR